MTKLTNREFETLATDLESINKQARLDDSYTTEDGDVVTLEDGLVIVRDEGGCAWTVEASVLRHGLDRVQAELEAGKVALDYDEDGPELAYARLCDLCPAIYHPANRGI